MRSSIIFAGLTGLASIVAAHPGHDARAEAEEYVAYMEQAPPQARSLSHCTETLKARGHEKASVERRHNAVQKLREARGLTPRM